MVINVVSDRMPHDVKIGEVESCKLNASKTAYSAVVKIAADMQRLGDLLIVENRDETELFNLMSTIQE